MFGKELSLSLSFISPNTLITVSKESLKYGIRSFPTTQFLEKDRKTSAIGLNICLFPTTQLLLLILPLFPHLSHLPSPPPNNKTFNLSMKNSSAMILMITLSTLSIPFFLINANYLTIIISLTSTSKKARNPHL